MSNSTSQEKAMTKQETQAEKPEEKDPLLASAELRAKVLRTADEFDSAMEHIGKSLSDSGYPANEIILRMRKLYEQHYTAKSTYRPTWGEFLDETRNVIDEGMSNYNFNARLTNFFKEGNSPFLNEISRWVRKTEAGIPTAAMGYNKESDEFNLFYGRTFMSLLTPGEHNSVLKHELFHLVFKHVTSRRREPHMLWNISADCAINSIIASEGGSLPECVILPGKRPKSPGKFASPEAKEAHENFADIIEKAPQMQSSEFYFDLIQKATENNPKGGKWGQQGLIANDGSNVGVGPMDDHGAWDTIPEEIRSMVENKMKEIVKNGVRRADSMPQGWGSIPESVREEIRASVSDAVDWRTLLRRFVGMHVRGAKRSSLKRINKRYPYMHPGRSISYLPLGLIAVDQSGSVDDHQLEQIFGVLGALAKKTTFHLVNFDTEVDEKSYEVWNRGKRKAPKRTRCGGTDFGCVQKWLHKKKMQSKFDFVVILSDGECSKPPASRVPRAWVITPGNKLYFEPDVKDIVIYMDQKNQKK